MLSNAYFLANVRFDTAENEPAKNVAKNIYKLQIVLPFLLILIKGTNLKLASFHSCKSRHYLTPKKETLIRIFGGFSGLSLLFIPFIIPSFAPVLPQVVSRHARNF